MIKVALRVSSENLSLSEITEFMGEPTEGYSKGDLWRKNRLREQSLWIYSFDSRELSFEDCISGVLHRLDLSRNGRSFCSSFISVDVFIFLSIGDEQCSFSLSPKDMKILADNDVAVLFDVYGG